MTLSDSANSLVFHPLENFYPIVSAYPDVSHQIDYYIDDYKLVTF